MDFLNEIVISFTPQVFFGMIGGFLGGLFGIDKQEYGLKISTLLMIVAVIAGSAVADVLYNKWGLSYLWLLCLISVPTGAVSGFLMDALKTASPTLAAKVVKKLGDKAVAKID